jgi:hypothetical protein
MFNKNKTTHIRITPIVLPEKNTKPIIPFVAKKNTIKPYKLINHVNSFNVNSNNLPPPRNTLESITKNNINNISEINIMMSESNLKKIPKLK